MTQRNGRTRENPQNPQNPQTRPTPRPESGSSPKSDGGSGHRSRRGRGRGRTAGPRPETLEKLKAARAAVRPTLRFPEELPVSARHDDIAAAIRDNQVVIIAGETGSGKTTQIPKICLELGYGIDGMIGHTQPRRIAARAVAARLAEETELELGTGIGYQVRFTSQTTDDTRVKVMTDGILLAELRADPQLRKYDVIIIDEAHERSLNIDFLLGYLTRLLPQRPDLKLVVTSATIDPESFSTHFSDAPIIEVSGRTYPVEIRYRPLAGEEVSDDEDDGPGADGRYESGAEDQTEGVIAAVDELSREAPGDVLVFLSGEREIRDTAEAVRAHLQRKGPRYANWEVLPLFGRLSAAEQQRIFSPHGAPRIVLATNVAETSLTVPGIKYVVDAGTARISRYSNRTKVQRLPIERVSQASAAQRTGRCGRTSDGICIRLYSEKDFVDRAEFTDPEILRTNLASVILQMCSLGFADSAEDVISFPFITGPDPRAVRDGIALLSELGALSTEKGALRLTSIGRGLAHLPIDPRLARMLIAGAEAGVGGDVAVIVAGLSIQDPRERPTEVRETADAHHARFTDPASDFLSLLNLWNYLEDASARLSSSKFRRLCKSEFLNFVRIREWQDFVRQLRTLAGNASLTIGHATWSSGEIPGAGVKGAAGAVGEPGSKKHKASKAEILESRLADDHAASIHRSLLTGLLSSIGTKSVQGSDYLGARGTKFAIFPGSGLFRTRPELVMAAELVETSRLWARTVAAIKPEWAVEAGEHVVKRQYSDPHWSKSRAQAVANERISLYGVPLVTDHPVGYGRIDQAGAREIFIHSALVAGEWNDRHGFRHHNARVLAEAEEMASRFRDRRLLAEDLDLFAHYDAKLPAEVVSGAHFNSWWKKKRQHDPHFLDLSIDDVLAEETEHQDASDYPLTWELVDGTEAKLKYAFDPGAESDGVTAIIPAEALSPADAQAFTWQVPGLRHELVTALIRSLPKPKRKYFVPAPDVARAVLNEMTPYEGRLTEVLAAALSSRAGGGELADLVPVTIDASDFDESRVPAHLRMSFVLKKGKRTVARPKDAEHLTKAAPRADAATRARSAGFTARTGLTEWAPIPAAVHDAKPPVHPGLRDEVSSVSLVAHDSAEAARRGTFAGLVRLLALRSTATTDYALRSLGTKDTLALAGHGTATRPVAAETTFAAIAGLPALTDLRPEVARVDVLTLDTEGFARLASEVNRELLPALEALLPRVAEIFVLAEGVNRAVSKNSSLAVLRNQTDVLEQVADLVAEGFLSRTDPVHLGRLPVYLRAHGHRVEKMQESPARDTQLMDRMHGARRSVLDKLARLYGVETASTAELASRVPAAAAEILWDLHELGISLYAPHLGTAHSVSEQRIAKALAKLG